MPAETSPRFDDRAEKALLATLGDIADGKLILWVAPAAAGQVEPLVRPSLRPRDGTPAIAGGWWQILVDRGWVTLPPAGPQPGRAVLTDTGRALTDVGISRAGDVLTGALVPHDPAGRALQQMRARLAVKLGELDMSRPEPSDTPQDATSAILESRWAISWEIYERLVEEWPTGDFRGASLDRLRPDQHGQQCQAWAAARGARTLIVGGKVGRGKTHAAFALLRHFAEQGARVRAWTEKRYLDVLRPDGDPNLPAWRVRRYADASDVFLLDELGGGRTVGQRVTEFVESQIEELISGRLAAGKRLIVTTNLEPKQLEVMYGPRVASRLQQQTHGILFEGPDLRVSMPSSWAGFNQLPQPRNGGQHG